MDHTIDQLSELTVTAREARSRDYGTASLALAEHRDALAAEAEQTARAAGAVIHTARAIMLLFDVLVGITTGTLPHDQESWTRVTRRGPDCGTYRCVAGWLSHAAFPNLRPHRREYVEDWAIVEYAAAADTDGTRRTYAEWAALALDVEYSTSGPERLFTASANLGELWDAAGRLTGGAITIPPHLVDEVVAVSIRHDDEYFR
jgi:hypothetical protein